MSNLKKFIVIIVVAIVSYFLQSCSTHQVAVNDVKVEKQLPQETPPLVLNKIKFYTVNESDASYMCIYSKDIDKFSLNETKKLKYIEQLINENAALRKLIKEE